MQMEKGRREGGSKRDSLPDYATSAREKMARNSIGERGRGRGEEAWGIFQVEALIPFPNQSLDRMAREGRMTMVDEGMSMRGRIL